MRVNVLGALEVVAEGRPVRPGGVRLRALLIRLALEPDRTVSVQALTEALWPDGDVDEPRHALQSLVSRLRRVLPAVLCTEPAGYRLEAEVDAIAFERLAREGRAVLHAGRPHDAVGVLDEALALWRGEPLADVADLPFARAAAVCLEELRLGAVEDRAEAGLAIGEPPVMEEIRALIARHPLRERLRILLVGTLAAKGRTAEALAAFADYRRLIVDELGADPGPELRELHLRLLRDEPARRRGNLPVALTGLVGRDDDRGRVAERLDRARLVTLVGPGGVGKTRLATAVVGHLAEPAWLVELASVRDPRDVPHAVAASLGLPASPDAMDRIVEVLRDAVVILDNCEHVLEAAAALAERLLGRCAGLRVLATSREALGLPGEAVYTVAPLDEVAAVWLFTERARAARPDFAPSGQVAEICRRLDGLPLAIELAAARLRSMPLETLASELDLIAGRSASARHRSLRAVVAWSWDLLTGDEQVAAMRLAVFPASFTVEAAEHAGVPGHILAGLADKSLLQLLGNRYRMLETIRSFGRDRLAATGLLDAAQAAHAAYYLALAERAEPELRGPGQLSWLPRLEAEREHFAAAFGQAPLRFGAALGMFWAIHGDHGEAVDRLGEALRTPGSADIRLQAEAAYLLNAVLAGRLAEAVEVPAAAPAGPVAAFVAALVALASGETERGVAALEPYWDVEDAWTRAMLRLARSFLHEAVGDAAHRDIEAAAVAFREAGERWGLMVSLLSLAFDRAVNGDTEAALAMVEEADECGRDLGAHDDQRVWLAMVRMYAGDLPGAGRHLDGLADTAMARVCRAELARWAGDRAEAARLLDHGDGGLPVRLLRQASAGFLALENGDHDAAAAWFSAARDSAVAMPDPPMLAHVAVGLADLLHRRGAVDKAAELLGAAAVLRGGPCPRHPDVVRLTRALNRQLPALTREEALAAVSIV
ncbi:BTAD domain-containing putative transcriptional regulator [Nonomuraea sp. NPDC050680]|uniref:BTAD domain-containing putative transcriptional regulator n=1 Tax=Nonomuraea sp. NPDC050680 TaxID=3154630 RepID=UPI0033D490E0